jgi:hypothetical protein
MATDGLGVAIRKSTHGAGNIKLNSDYDPAKQVSGEDMRTARSVLHRMISGGELMAAFQVPFIRQAVSVLDECIAASDRRAADSRNHANGE